MRAPQLVQRCDLVRQPAHELGREFIGMGAAVRALGLQGCTQLPGRPLEARLEATRGGDRLGPCDGGAQVEHVEALLELAQRVDQRLGHPVLVEGVRPQPAQQRTLGNRAAAAELGTLAVPGRRRGPPGSGRAASTALR